MGAPRHRLVLIGSNLELRIVSIIVRARESVDEVVLLDRGSSDATVELAERLECPVLTHLEEHITASSLASLLKEGGLKTRSARSSFASTTRGGCAISLVDQPLA